ncbi:urease accessory protein UreD [Amphibiibacter pelophylacis]|uniref:Urease accessory protein UreD n=1 Tax=Amphibiibacter pelophylacis TaxID=1799477 RepID=A0ACC6P1C0_9BURK
MDTPTGWRARLHLGFARQGERSVLAHRQFSGPLRVQKALYPEGPSICHAHVLHPPSGIAEGDDLAVSVHVGAQAHAVLTTPGATHWYKSPRHGASLSLALRTEAGAALEWLPLENIFFDDAQVRLVTRIDLDPGSFALGWEGGQWGRRPDAGGHLLWQGARVQADTQLRVGDELLWLEQGHVASGDALLQGDQGWGAFPCQASLWCYHAGWTAAHAQTLAETLPWTPDLRAAVSCLPRDSGPGGLLLLRVLGRQMQAVRSVLAQTRLRLRQHSLNRPGADLRIWAT